MRDYQESVTTGQTDRRTMDKVIPMCRYASQATQICVCETQMPPDKTKLKSSKISKSDIVTPPNPHGMSVKCYCTITVKTCLYRPINGEAKSGRCRQVSFI